jgi:hypothetical protein
MPAPQLHLSFALSIPSLAAVPRALRRAASNEEVYARLGAIVHDLPYYGNMVLEAIRYGLEALPLDAPWSYRMHCVEPARFVASFIRAAATTPGFTADERLALVGGLASHCALDLALHPLVNHCARRDHKRYGGHEAFHHRIAEKYHALFLHLERLGFDPIGSPEMRRWTRVVKHGSLVEARAESHLIALIRDGYIGAYGDAPDGATWAGWVRSFAHFGLMVSTPFAAHNSARVRKDPAWRERFYENDQFRFPEFYACAERRLATLTALCHDYFSASDFSRAAEQRFVAQSGIDDLAEPTPSADLPLLVPIAQAA